MLCIHVLSDQTGEPWRPSRRVGKTPVKPQSLRAKGTQSGGTGRSPALLEGAALVELDGALVVLQDAGDGDLIAFLQILRTFAGHRTRRWDIRTDPCPSVP